MSSQNSLEVLSEGMSQAAEKAGSATALVNARRKFPASGIVYAADLVLTADHVLEHDEDITVQFPDGNEIKAGIAGRDPGTDLALLRLETSSQTTAEISGQAARIGQLVLALGRPSANGLEASLGVVSALSGPVRTGRGSLLDQYIRTDAILYPGFSGGPLVDVSGKVLGLNTSGLAHGIALTIPAGMAWGVADTLNRFGRVKRGYLGVRSQLVAISVPQQQVLGRQQATGLLLVYMEPGGPAETGGLMVGDILVAIAGQPISDPDELLTRLSGVVVGQSTEVQLLRGGSVMTLAVTVGERK